MNYIFFNVTKVLHPKLNLNFYRTLHNSTQKTINSIDHDREYFGTTEKTKNLYQNVSKDFEKIMDLSTFRTHNHIRSKVVKYILPLKGTRILDGAGGTGLATSAILQYAKNKNEPLDFHITVCDISPALMSIGQNKIKNTSHEKLVDWIEGDIQNLPFKNESFNSYIITYGFRAVNDIKGAFQQGYRILKPGGKMVILEFISSDTPTILQRLYYYSYKTIFYILLKYRFGQGDLSLYMAENLLKNPKKEEMVAMMEDSGFKNITCIPQMMGIMVIYVGHKPQKDN